MGILTLSVVRVFAACVICCYLSTAAPVITTEAQAMMFFQKYGYMAEIPSNSLSLTDGASFFLAIKDFQKFTGLDETGILDDQTLKMMNLPRCGVRDVDPSGLSPYVLEGGPYYSSGSHLTYKITKYPTKIKDRAIVDEEFAKAFKVWSDVSSLKFEVFEPSLHSNPVTIEIRFEMSEHGCIKNFEGRDNVLAHAASPSGGSDIHFDDRDKWTIRGFSGINLFQTAVHEIGHSLGLMHTNVTSAVMFASYLGYNPSFTLDEDDILGIQKMYGGPEPKPDAKPDVSGAPDLCRNPSIDAATMTADGRIYVFKGNYYWEIGETGISDGYPRKISDDWQGLPGNLDAALTWENDITYFFKKNQYWKFQNKNMGSGYPLNISAGFPGIPNDIDAAFVWGGDDFTYFFKGDTYWRYDGSSIPAVSSDYPQPISNWKGLPIDIDAAFQSPTRMAYVFKGSKYYRISEKTKSVYEADPPYPRSTSASWLHCAPDLCRDSCFDAAATSPGGGHTYVFKGNYYWKIVATGISDGYPRKISHDWPGLPGDLDAAMTSAEGKTYFFKKNQYWRFHNKNMDSGYPKSIADGFPGIPNDIDSAFVWSLNGKIYFFKGDNYWKYDRETKPPVSDHYPQPISTWQGVPNNIDASLQLNRKTYFFKGSQYYRFNDTMLSVVPPYPRSTYLWWFDCERVLLKGNQLS